MQNLGEKSTSSVQADNDYRYTWENVANYSVDFNQRHNLIAMIGSSTTAYGEESVLASGANQASSLTSFHDLRQMPIQKIFPVLWLKLKWFHFWSFKL